MRGEEQPLADAQHHDSSGSTLPLATEVEIEYRLNETDIPPRRRLTIRAVVAIYRFTIHVAAPVDTVFRVWTDLDQMRDWVGGVTGVTDVTGPVERAGTRYTVRFGRMTSETEVLEADPPHLLRTRFGNRLLRGENLATFVPDGDGTRVTVELRTQGWVSALAARIFATGSYRGSFKGELLTFARLVENPSTDRAGRGERG